MSRLGVVRYVNGNGGCSGDSGVRGNNKANKYGSDDIVAKSPMGTFEAPLKVITTSERFFDGITRDHLQDVLGTLTECI